MWKILSKTLLPLFLMVAAFPSCCPVIPPTPQCPDLKLSLPAEQSPLLRQVELYQKGDYCLTDQGRRDVLINMRLLWQYGDANKSVIEEYNKGIK
jgi:hypothetical protein